MTLWYKEKDRVGVESKISRGQIVKVSKLQVGFGIWACGKWEATYKFMSNELF